MSKILVTGGTGFIGSHLTCKLLSEGHEVIVIGNNTEVEIQNAICLQCHLGGIDYSRLGKIDLCFHIAGNNDTISMDKKEMFLSNVEWPKDLFKRLFSDHGCQKIVYASSASIYGNGPLPFKETNDPNPLSYYAESKLAFDEWVISNNFPSVGIRYSNVYGPREFHKGRRASMIHKIVQSILNKTTIQIFKFGEQKRDWVYVEDVVSLNILAMKNPICEKIINCGSGNSIDFNSIVNVSSNLIGIPAKIQYIECQLGDNFQKNSAMCLERAKSIGYQPEYPTVEKGIKNMIGEKVVKDGD